MALSFLQIAAKGLSIINLFYQWSENCRSKVQTQKIATQKTEKHIGKAMNET